MKSTENATVTYTQTALEAAFAKVAPDTHWKDPIDSFCHASEMAITKEAVIHFTATVPTFQPMQNHRGWFLVKAEGYRKGPAGDH